MDEARESAEIQAHVGRRWKLLSSIPFPDANRQVWNHVHGGHRVYVSRTVAPVDAGDAGVPVVREIEFMNYELIERAERRIIIEGQYYWSRRFNELLVAKMERMRGRPFEVVIVLAELAKLKSFSRQMGTHQLGLLARLQDAARRYGTKLTVGVPYSHPPEDEEYNVVRTTTAILDPKFERGDRMIEVRKGAWVRVRRGLREPDPPAVTSPD